MKTKSVFYEMLKERKKEARRQHIRITITHALRYLIFGAIIGTIIVYVLENLKCYWC